jgi:phage host-nuclease inhibitor protein Gam
MARKKVQDVPALASWEEVNQALAIIADCERSKEAIEAEMQEAIDNEKTAAEMGARPYVESIKKLERQIMLFVEANKDDLGTKKTKLLNFGKVGFRKSTKVSVPRGRQKIDDIIRRLKARGMDKCIKVTPPTVNKDVLRTYDADIITEVGATLNVEDIFWYEADRTKLPEK